MESLPSDVMKQYITNLNKRRAKTITVLGRENKLLVQFFETEMGQELFGWLQGKHEELLSKIASIKATDEEKIEYGLVHEWLLSWSDKYDRYLKTLKMVDNEMQIERARHDMIQ